jgi:Flp pilus assembly protein CpaB
MRASTLFAITLSLLLGLGAAAGARYAGLFDKKEAAAPPPKPPVKILVAKTNLYEDIMVSADQVMLRDLRPEEQAYYEANKDKLMPALVMAAHQRTAKRNLMADQPLLKSDFSEVGLPDQISLRLAPGTRSVTVSVAKNDAAGGVIRIGEYVDVLLTTKVSGGGSQTVRTATLARGCKVVTKRNSLVQFLASDPDAKPVTFGLEANPYRAALIQFAGNRGTISLMPVPTAARRSATGGWSDPSSKEYADEDQRVEAIGRGELAISDTDLERIFRITPPVPTPEPLRIKHVVGVTPQGETVFPGTAASAPQAAARPATGTQPAGGLSFTPPGSPDADGGCKTCGKPADPAATSGSKFN